MLFVDAKTAVALCSQRPVTFSWLSHHKSRWKTFENATGNIITLKICFGSKNKTENSDPNSFISVKIAGTRTTKTTFTSQVDIISSSENSKVQNYRKRKFDQLCVNFDFVVGWVLRMNPKFTPYLIELGPDLFRTRSKNSLK